MRTTVILDDALFQDATKIVLEEWLAKSEPPPRRWKTLVIEQGLHALLRDKHMGRRVRDDLVVRPKNLTIIVDDELLHRAEAAVSKEFGEAKEKMAGLVINQGLRALLRERASRRLAAAGGAERELGEEAAGDARPRAKV
jgi:hypothetical protein